MGRMGTLLRLLFAREHLQLSYWSRSKSQDVATGYPDSLDHEFVFLTVNDNAVKDVATALASRATRNTIVIHTSGALPSTILRDSGLQGPVASLHPLLAIGDPHAALDRIGSVVWTVEGDEKAVTFVRSLMARFEVTPQELRADDKALYHAAAVMSAGHVVALLDAAIEVATQAGIPGDIARDMLTRLATTAVTSVADLGVEDALTGPVARGDNDIVEAHLQALSVSEDIKELYRVLSDRSQEIAARNRGK